MELLARLLEDTDRRVWAPVRAGSDAEACERVRATLSSLVDDPDAYDGRVIALAADLEAPGLGLADAQRAELAEQVDEIIHCAASVFFTLPLERARAINVEGTRRVLELAWSSSVLLDFAVDCSWGRERVGRAQALAAVPA